MAKARVTVIRGGCYRRYAMLERLRQVPPESACRSVCRLFLVRRQGTPAVGLRCLMVLSKGKEMGGVSRIGEELE
jgi:hypothetical protein